MTDALATLQSGMLDYILGRSDRVLARVESSEAMSAERRLDIYHYAYRARLAEVMADTYERVVLYIGEENFHAAARAYIERHPPTTRNVRDYGRSLPEFLAGYFDNDPEVAELAAMDERLRYTFDAEDADALSVADVATLKPEHWDGAEFELHPTTSVLEFRWNTPAIWRVLSDEQALPAAERLAQPASWLFWRKEMQPHFRSLTPAESLALNALASGQPFGATCTLVANIFPELDITTAVAGWLRTWLDDGVLGSVRHEG